MKMQIRPVFFFAVCISALVPIGMLTAQAKAQIKQCSCFAIKNARALVLAPDRRAKMLVRRQDRDLEIIVAVACSGARASQGRRGARQRRHGET